MDRRTFVTALGAGILAPVALRQATPPDAPATPVPSGRPDPIDLGSGITLIDYRLHPGEQPHIIGEIRNETDRMIDAPVISLTYPRQSGNDGFTWAPPIVPVIGPGLTGPIFGPLPGDSDPQSIIETGQFALCSPAEPREYTAKQQAVEDDLVVTILSERKEESAYNAQGTIENAGRETLRELTLRGIVRDNDGRIAGTTASPFWLTISAGETRDYSIGARGEHKSDPFPLLTGKDYSVELIPGTRGPVASPGCSFGLPWD
jgi:hypothetical protein